MVNHLAGAIPPSVTVARRREARFNWDDSTWHNTVRNLEAIGCTHFVINSTMSLQFFKRLPASAAPEFRSIFCRIDHTHRRTLQVLT